jgi:hypothetical protein
MLCMFGNNEARNAFIFTMCCLNAANTLILNLTHYPSTTVLFVYGYAGQTTYRITRIASHDVIFPVPYLTYIYNIKTLKNANLQGTLF